MRFQVIFANLFINTKFLLTFKSFNVKDYFPPRLKLLTVSPGHRCSWMWIMFHDFYIFADKTNLDIKGGGAGSVSVVKGCSVGVEGRAVHHAEDDGETGDEEHLWWSVSNNISCVIVKVEPTRNFMFELELFSWNWKYLSRLWYLYWAVGPIISGSAGVTNAFQALPAWSLSVPGAFTSCAKPSSYYVLSARNVKPVTTWTSFLPPKF